MSTSGEGRTMISPEAIDRPIGVFDSGIGGLTVVKEMIRILPNENIIYFGDTARLPYGSKSEKTIKRFAIENAVFLSSFGVKAIVVACNTVSAVALGFLNGFVKLPIIGVVEPGAEAAVRATKSKRVGVIATKTTVRMHAYAACIKELDADVEVHEVAAPLLVHLVEENWSERQITKEILKEYLHPLLDKNIDTLVLGCTHYPFLSKAIEEVAPNLNLINSASETAVSIRRLLRSEQLVSNKHENGSIRIFLSDLHPDSTRWVTDFLKSEVPIEGVEPHQIGS
jgi:glutamate racemase